MRRTGSATAQRELIPGDVPSALAELGIAVLGDDGDNFKIQCPAHQERVGKTDAHPSCYVHSESGVFICFSCEWAGPFSRLVAWMHGTDRASATAWIASKGTIGRALRLLRGSEEEESDSPEVTEAHLALFTDPPETARRQRGLTLASCQKYGVLWDQHRECWILPIRDGDGQLLGWQEKSRRHFRNFPDGVAKGTTLFGGHIGTTPTLVMVESPLDTVRMDSVGIEGGRATYGVHVTPEQIRQAMNTSSCIILAQDNDRPGRKARAKLYRTYRCRGTRLLYWDYSECTAKDPGEMNAFELYDAYDAAYSPLTRRLTLRQ